MSVALISPPYVIARLSNAFGSTRSNVAAACKGFIDLWPLKFHLILESVMENVSNIEIKFFLRRASFLLS